MDHDVRSLDDSNFIRNYVASHKAELDQLRAKATALAFTGKWFIIGETGYVQKRLQYATTSFARSRRPSFSTSSRKCKSMLVAPWQRMEREKSHRIRGATRLLQ